MPKAKNYEPRCPSVSCSSRNIISIPRNKSMFKRIPEGIAEKLPEGERIGYCVHCGLMWTQPGKFKNLDIDATPFGYYDESGEGKFTSIEPFSVKLREDSRSIYLEKKASLKKRTPRFSR